MEKFIIKHEDLGYLNNSNQHTSFVNKFDTNIELAKLYENPNQGKKVIGHILKYGYPIGGPTMRDVREDERKLIVIPVEVNIIEK